LDGLSILGILLVVVAVFPLIAFGAVAIRVAFIVALAAGALALLVSPTFRRWLISDGDPTKSYNGIRLPDEVMLHPTHTWARVANRDEVVVGIDDLLQKALGPPTAVELPRQGARVTEGSELFEVVRDGRSVAVRSPVSGTVVAANERLADQPDLMSSAPYSLGWAVRVAPSPPAGSKILLAGARARDWFRHEVDRLLVEVSGPTAGGAAMQDGGTLVDDFHAHLDESTWRRIKAAFFGDHR
jgi:glycine cleavage system H lipoate-binding protein